MIIFTPELLDVIYHHAAETYPDECCGAILGHFVQEKRNVVDILPIDNKRTDGEAYHRFVITPKDFLSCEKTARTLECDVIGFYHSHPDHPAKPSQYDLDHALPVYSYVIVSVEQGTVRETASWVLRNDVREFETEELKTEN